MKKLLLTVTAALMLTGCEKASEWEMQTGNPTTARITFNVSGDFTSPQFTRAMSADGMEMTELFVFDFVGGECVQWIRQTSDDADFGTPTLEMANGGHTVCFVASRGSDYSIDESALELEWQRPSDTFFASKAVTVAAGVTGSVSVELSRVATRLRLSIQDAVPDGVASVSIIPSKWYYGLNYKTGKAACPHLGEARVIQVPASYVGSTLSVSIFGMSDPEEWQTDVSVAAMNGGGEPVSTVAIHNAPFVANRVTSYSGRLFTGSNGFSITLNDNWLEDYVMTW